MPGRRRFLSRIALLACAPLAGCATIDRRRRVDALEPTVRAFAQAIRWGRIEVASALVSSRDATLPPYDLGALREVQVTSSQMRLDDVNEAADEARVTMVFDYRPADSSTVRTLTVHDTWWYDAAREGWFLDGTLPRFPR